MNYLPGPHNKVFSHVDTLKDFINEEIQNHKKDLDPSNARDYIDAFIIEMDKVCEQLHKLHSLWTVKLTFLTNSSFSEQNKDTNLGFSETNLALCSLDLFIAGTETTSTTLLWALVYLINNPDIQGGCLDTLFLHFHILTSMLQPG